MNDLGPVTLQYYELALGADIKWEYKGLLVQGEAVLNDRAYQSPRPVDLAVFSGPPGYTPDFRRYGAYGLVGYRTPWLNIMPCAVIETEFDGNNDLIPHKLATYFGFNVRPTSRVVFKIEYLHAHASGVDPAAPIKVPDFDVFNSQIAWSF